MLTWTGSLRVFLALETCDDQAAGTGHVLVPPAVPAKAGEQSVAKLALTPQALALLLDGVDLRGGQLRP